MYKMKKLEEFVIEKLKVSANPQSILDTDIYELSSIDEFNEYLGKVDEWLQANATKVPKDKSNKNKLNIYDFYIYIDDGYKVHSLSIGYKNKETLIFMPADVKKVMKSNYTGSIIGWRNYDPLFIVPDELKDDVIEIINYKI